MSETMSASEVAALPMDERAHFALLNSGLDESEAQAALEAVLPLFAADLRSLASKIEWKYRSMSFSCGRGESSTRLHASGATIRAYADTLFQPPPPTEAVVAERDERGVR